MATVMTFTDARFDNMHICGRSVGGGGERGRGYGFPSRILVMISHYLYIFQSNLIKWQFKPLATFSMTRLRLKIIWLSP